MIPVVTIFGLSLLTRDASLLCQGLAFLVERTNHAIMASNPVIRLEQRIAWEHTLFC
jgi:hypothetical protein